jgi:predicted kinase
MTSVLYPDLPENGLIVLIGASGAGKSTLARTWPASQVLSLDALRGMVSDDPGDQSATGDAADVLQLVLERRMARKLNTVIDATNVERDVRADLVTAARRHGMPAVAVLLTVPLSTCLARQEQRPANRRVPDDTVRAQHEALVSSQLTLETEGFSHICFVSALPRLGAYLRLASEAREAALDMDDDLRLPARVFGPGVLPLWHWREGPDAMERGRTAELRLGSQHVSLRAVSGCGEGDHVHFEHFEVLMPCPECDRPIWVPADSVTDLYLALVGISRENTCTAHGTRREALT